MLPHTVDGKAGVAFFVHQFLGVLYPEFVFQVGKTFIQNHLQAILHMMLEAVKKHPNHQVVVSDAPGIEPDFYRTFIKNTEINVVFNQTYELLTHARVVVVNSGTANLETALIGTVQVVVYKVAFGRIAMQIKPLIIKIKFVSFVNL